MVRVTKEDGKVVVRSGDACVMIDADAEAQQVLSLQNMCRAHMPRPEHLDEATVLSFCESLGIIGAVASEPIVEDVDDEEEDEVE